MRKPTSSVIQSVQQGKTTSGSLGLGEIPQTVPAFENWNEERTNDIVCESDKDTTGEGRMHVMAKRVLLLKLPHPVFLQLCLQTQSGVHASDESTFCRSVRMRGDWNFQDKGSRAWCVWLPRANSCVCSVTLTCTASPRPERVCLEHK